VLSDSFNNRGDASADVASGDLPGPGNPFGFTTPVTVVQDLPSDGTDEGRAMLQIVHDLAPGAQLFFATGFLNPFSFATNIMNLQSIYNCNIIVDDITYFDEGVFQDDLIAKAVNTVTAAGALYFSSAGNFGNLDDGTAGVWEGDFVDGGTLAILPGGHVHDFGGGVTNDRITDLGFQVLELKWSDPLGASTNDYDLFVLDPTLSFVRASSTTTQNGTQDPRERLFENYFTNDRIVIVRRNGAATRALHLNTNGGRLAIATSGQTFGHNAGASTVSVAAVSASTAGGGPFSGGPANPLSPTLPTGRVASSTILTGARSRPAMCSFRLMVVSCCKSRMSPQQTTY
jgi:hypothetical protein